ncbi:hypothetical protein KEM54_001307 [Ascosphaera aggregata]|nr:hypothetical protein KEM54_001307 [Ascosphaera aggregata]
MSFDRIIVDPSLQPVLITSAETLAQCQHLLDLINPQSQSQTITNATATASTDQNTLHAISIQQKKIFAHLAKLRGLNREAILTVRATKQATAEARSEIDRLHLHLQNLYYEQRHLNGEIAACESYEHKYADLPLIPVEEFLEKFPEHRRSAATAAAHADEQEYEHALMVARIAHEHAERETLEQQRQELLKKKEALIAENKKRKEDLARLDNDLERFIDAAKPIQKIFEKER